jgi:hypothetical protein
MNPVKSYDYRTHYPFCTVIGQNRLCRFSQLAYIYSTHQNFFMLSFPQHLLSSSGAANVIEREITFLRAKPMLKTDLHLISGYTKITRCTPLSNDCASLTSLLFAFLIPSSGPYHKSPFSHFIYPSPLEFQSQANLISKPITNSRVGGSRLVQTQGGLF